MSELRKDPVTGRWVIISTERRKRPTDFRLESVTVNPDSSCPFCAGHEHMTPRELLAAGRNGSGPDTPGWSLRVIPNQFPVLRVEGTLDRQGEGLFDKMNGIGAHEVIIESPRHDDTLATLDADRVEQVLWACRERISDLKRDQRFRYIIIFKNHGSAAGASLEHSCSQLIALPIVPREVRDEVDGSRAHYETKERCVFCDILRQETADGRRMIAENADMVAVAPYAPRFPFETWILPTPSPVALRGRPAPRVRVARAAARRHPAADEQGAADAALQPVDSQRAGRGEGRGVLPLARRDHPQADEGCRIRMGDRVLSQPDLA